MDEYLDKYQSVNGFTVLKILGEGRYGIAYLGSDEQSQKVVIKQLKNNMLERSRKKLFYEQKVLESIDHECVPKFIDTFKDEMREGYILGYIEGAVFEDIVVRDEHVFNRADIYEVARQLLGLIEVLQQHHIVHRDIRLPNVILTQQKKLALIDFGLARFIDDKRYLKEMDYWFLADFLIHLYYTFYEDNGEEERPWYEELDLTKEELNFLKRLMGIDASYEYIDEIKEDLGNLQIILEKNGGE